MRNCSWTGASVMLGAVWLLDGRGVLAQAPNAIEQLDTIKRREQAEQGVRDAKFEEGFVTQLYLGEMRDVGPQSILKREREKYWFEAGADSQFFFTSNMFLEEDEDGTDLTETTVFANTVHVAVAPTGYGVGGGSLEPRVGFRHTWFNYGLGDRASALNDFDFDAQSVFAEVRYRRWENWIVEVGFDWTRLLGHTPDYFDYDEFYKEYVPRWAVLRQIPISESKVFTVGYQGSYRLTEVGDNPRDDVNDRTDQILFVSYNQALTPQLVVQPYYRFQFTHYTKGGSRNDLFHTAGLSLNYFFTQNISLRAFASYERRDSDDPIQADYDKLDAGAGLNLYFRF